MSYTDGAAQHVLTSGKRLPGHPSVGGKKLPNRPSTSGKRLPEHHSTDDERLPEHPSTGGKRLPGCGSIGGKKLPECVVTGTKKPPEPVPETDLELDDDNSAVVDREFEHSDDEVPNGKTDYDNEDVVLNSELDNDSALPEPEVDADTTPLPRKPVQDAETSGDDCSSSDDEGLTSPQTTQTATVTRKKHRSMTAAQQFEEIKRLQAQLDRFPQPDKKQDSVMALPAKPNQTASPAMPESPISHLEDPKPGPKPRARKRKRAPLTNIAQVESPQSHENVEPKRAKKLKTSKPEISRKKVCEKISPEAKVVMSTLRDLGSGFETSLDAVATNAGAVLSASGHGGNAAVGADVAGLIDAWKESHREHLGAAVGLLERYGVLAMGAVEVPHEDKGGDASGGSGEEAGCAGRLFDGVEIGENGEARISEA